MCDKCDECCDAHVNCDTKTGRESEPTMQTEEKGSIISIPAIGFYRENATLLQLIN